MSRAETKERNRRALLDAALHRVTRDGHRARLDEIAAEAGLTTGAVYSLFGSKNGLLMALVADYLEPFYEEMRQAVPAGADLLGAVEAFARYYWRTCEDPDARAAVALQISLLDMALRDSELGERFATSVRAQEEQLIALFTGRAREGGSVTPGQAQRLATALRALFVGLSQGVALGLAHGVDEQYFADAARALAANASFLGQGRDTAP
ncbi:TetR/AcrR family transcriptional regulator [Actinomadura hibisca]|uniref:TetR/AcrR family transcriptional regulator n=1 Tax=Actinomadura hibisca TaxID=68565 RepID=UPI00082FCC6D|nr:TetR/AcrR family transcriptional regulator [Actinomadura hibisca]